MLRLLYIFLNLLGFPGLGTLLSGRRKTGLAQIGLAAMGYALTIGGAGLLIQKLNHSGMTPQEISEALLNGTLLPAAQLWSQLGCAIIGVGLFGISWLWAALTPQGPKASTPPPLPTT